MKITHLTSVHPRFDTRIFHKMCSSIAAAGHEVTLVVADGLGSELRNGVSILDAGAFGGRKDRILNAPRRILSIALTLEPDIFHLHDPELLPIGLRLKRMRQRVIFDSHEDAPAQILEKPYLNRPTLWVIASCLQRYESWACRRFDGVVAATPYIRDKFLRINSETVAVNNFPLLNELAADVPWNDKQAEVCYVGGIGKVRGILEMIQAMSRVQSQARLNLCGKFNDQAVEAAARANEGWAQVNDLGFVDRVGLRDVLGRSVAGLVTFHPAHNHMNAQPNKMFEYMSAGIPVIASNFPLWRGIVEGSECGLCVDPLNWKEIASAIDYLVRHPQVAREMGRNGRRAVETHYNWSTEQDKLLAFYRKVLS